MSMKPAVRKKPPQITLPKRRTVTIGGVAYVQEELTLAQTQAVAEVFAEVFDKDEFDVTTASAVEIVKKLNEAKSLERVIGILLLPENGRVLDVPSIQSAVGQLPMSTVVGIVTDFLSLNRDWIVSLVVSYATLTTHTANRTV